jgi:hypothetical protein
MVLRPPLNPQVDLEVVMPDPETTETVETPTATIAAGVPPVPPAPTHDPAAYGVGDDYGNTALEALPDLFFALVMADALSVKWHQLSLEQQVAYKAERDRRHKLANPEPPAAVEDTSDGTPETTAPPEAPVFNTARVTEVNVDEAEEAIAKVKTVEELDALSAAETAASNRKGVHAAIEKRREELEAEDEE